MARFRTRARTVDMLGRQQIAGIPTAISELFKNSYDAYAKHIEVDFYRPENLLVIRDDGLGMALEDVEERWLVLGTESKLDDDGGLRSVASDLGLPVRRPTGEKGIGRLAIATIGPQVLLVTRAIRAHGLMPTVISFINWSLFELPGISIDEIDVPVIELSEDSLPNASQVVELVDAVRTNLMELAPRTNTETVLRIEDQLRQASLDVRALQNRFERASLRGSQAGTQFFIQPVDPMLEEALDARTDLRRVGDLQKMLMGFTNTMTPGHATPPVIAEFRDHKFIDSSESVIGPDEFFTPEDFESADHHFHGQFDEYGQFAGTVSIYGREPQDHSIVWPDARGRKTACGPFAIDFAYLQGTARESRMPQEERGRLMSKLRTMGGLYIYRNGMRILPYGNVDHDYLRIEERRNLGAGYYFFSYRRMFGVINLPSESSSSLVEKAGREGFRENIAYRQFRSILENFFVQLAADYFRDETSRGEEYRQTRDQLEKQFRARERQSRQSRARRRELAAALESKAAALNENGLTETVQSVIQKLATELEGTRHIEDSDRQVRAILRAQGNAQEQIAQLKESLWVARPRGVGLPKSLLRDLNAYRAEYARVEREVFDPAIKQIEEGVSTATRKFKLEVGRRRRFDVGTEVARKSAMSTVTARGRESRATLRETTDRVGNAIREVIAEFETTLNEVAQRVQRADLTNLTDEELVQLRLDLDSDIETAALEKRELLEAISQQLEAITVLPDGSGHLITQLDVAEAVEEDLLALQERAEADIELTQLGMAIEIIDHEFQSTIRSIRTDLRRFRAWADVNEQLAEVYNGIRINFEHLDSYLTLFTPLHRRLYRTEIEIKGSEIAKFLTDLFRERLSRHQIELRISREFRRHRIRGYPSTFYPVFVNLLDNAIFWLQDSKAPRSIVLHIAGAEIIVADNGPGVGLQDREAIFDMGFTRKPGGRGLGLHISRDVLAKVGYELVLHEPTDRHGAVFLIHRKDKSDE